MKKEKIENKIADLEMEIFIDGKQSDKNYEKLNKLKQNLNQEKEKCMTKK